GWFRPHAEGNHTPKISRTRQIGRRFRRFGKQEPAKSRDIIVRRMIVAPTTDSNERTETPPEYALFAADLQPQPCRLRPARRRRWRARRPSGSPRALGTTSVGGLHL